MRRRANTIVKFDQTGSVSYLRSLDFGAPGLVSGASIQAMFLVDDRTVLLLGYQVEEDHRCVVVGKYDFESGEASISDVLPGYILLDAVRMGSRIVASCSADGSQADDSLIEVSLQSGAISPILGGQTPVASIAGLNISSLARVETDYGDIYIVGRAVPDGENWPFYGLFKVSPEQGSYEMVVGRPSPGTRFFGRRTIPNRACVVDGPSPTAVVASRLLYSRGYDLQIIGSYLHAHNLDEGGYPPRNWGWEGIQVDYDGRAESVSDLLPTSGSFVAVSETAIGVGGAYTPITAIGAHRYDVGSGNRRIGDPNGVVPEPTSTAFRGGWDFVHSAVLTKEESVYVGGAGFTEPRPGLLPGEEIPSITSPGLARWKTGPTGDDSHDTSFEADLRGLGQRARSAVIRALALDAEDQPIVVLPTWIEVG